MKNNKGKKEGFTLLEVIISMAIIAIMSVGIYNGYMIIIKQTKAGQVKQSAALEGKRVTEEIQAAIENNSFTFSNSEIKIGDRVIQKESEDSAGVYTTYLDEKYNDKDENDNYITKATAKYTEKITLTQTNKDTGGISFNDNSNLNSDDTNYKINISKTKQSDNQPVKDYIYDAIINMNGEEKDKSDKKELESQDKIILFMYLEKYGNSRTINIKNYKGDNVFENNRVLSFHTGKLNIYINFNSYKEIDNSELKDVQINVYNNTKTDVPNIYVEKSNGLNADVEIFKGQMNLYNNRAEDKEEAKIGNLYDIKVEIMKDKDILFTGYSKKNIH